MRNAFCTVERSLRGTELEVPAARERDGRTVTTHESLGYKGFLPQFSHPAKQAQNWSCHARR
jgi:hypothetical protein